ncbi:MAG: tetratricopeptide repeat protein, partial [Chloroflexi bacterium]|nr:tetratricopeptide repeat protein [Chloroflexota bacterium]
MSEHELWNELGNLYFMSGAYNQAVYAYNRSIQLDSSFGRPYSNLALAYVQQGKYSEAIDLYKRSIELLIDDDEKAVSWNRLGNVYRHLKDYQRAVVAYQRADELNPERAGEREDLGQLLYSSADGTPPHEDSKTDEADQPQNEADPTPASNLDEVPTPLSDEESASWVQADPAWYEQATSEVPDDANSPTWTELDFDENFDSASELEEDNDILFPKVEGDNLAVWLPIPEPLEGIEKQETLSEPSELPSAVSTPSLQETKIPTYTPLLTAKSGDVKTEERAERILQPVDVDVEEPSPSPAPFVLAVTQD